MMSALKILVSGSVNGCFTSFFERINKVNDKNGPFDMVLVTGSFFSELHEANVSWTDPDKKAALKIPAIPFYVLGPTSNDQARFYRSSEPESNEVYDSGFELDEKVTFLGKKGILTGSSGLKIAYFSGSQSSESSFTTFNEDDIATMVSTHQDPTSPIDILLTSQAPKDFDNYLEFVPPEMKQVSTEGSLLISRVAFSLKPRYHFAKGSCFVERRPYRNHRVLQESNRAVTRLFCIADVDNTMKQKWLYAFSIVPSCSLDRKELVKQPDGTTECPYLLLENLHEEKLQSTVGKNQFFYATDYSEDDRGQKGKRRRDGHNENFNNKRVDTSQRQNQNQTSIKCWFCLASPDVEKHLIASIGDFCYLALPKGALVPEHCLIIPIDHFRSSIECAEKQDLLQELERFKLSLKDFYASKECTPVFFERNFRSYHFQIHAVPLPKQKLDSVGEKIVSLAEGKGIKLKKIPPEMDLADLISPGVPYFYLEIPEISFKCFTQIQTRRGDGSRVEQEFPLQLGRELLVHSEILNLPDRIDWKACSVGKDEEIVLTESFKNGFKPHDFTL